MVELKFSSKREAFKVELNSGTVPKIEWNGRACELAVNSVPPQPCSQRHTD